jgi:hypothetical protein
MFSSINRGKSADYHGLAIEHIINAGKDMEKLLLLITNEIFRQGRVPETLKAGLLIPIFKNKGLKTQATNYRGSQHSGCGLLYRMLLWRQGV